MMSLTPDQFRKVGLGVVPSPSPFLTPRPEKRRADYRGGEWSSNRHEKDKEVNVQVLLRCRPLNEDEQRSNVQKVISCNEHRREVTVMQNLANKQIDRIFTFDKVFGPKAQQRSIYDQAIAPIVNEVLEGFNCTIFAYGQTGTGKTYTMEGGMRKKVGELPAEAGVIPRAVRQIFDTLEAQNADYSMKVTFSELYNEEITDLLASEDYLRYVEDRQKKPISLMEDGKGCVVIRGLEEVAVYSANEIYTLLEQGASKRRTADTLLNKRSSRSHSIFSITTYIKEATVGDEDLIKCGKLNLVDLAGSENISRSGAREGRAKEAGEINKSLLTLGRVINALVEHSPHIPYRDSKLTRLLRDSLGGKTKTCIIATISPSAHCLEETLSTLDYAYRAKNIKNKPEVNQKMSKAVLLKDLYAEIERMREDIRAAREKNGVYISQERFAQEQAEKKARNERIEELENDLFHSEKQSEKFRKLYHTEQEQKLDLESSLKNCKIDLETSNKALLDLQEQYRLALSTLKNKEFAISKLLQSESSIIDRAKELRSDLQDASQDLSLLFGKLDYKSRMEAENHNIVLTFGSQLDQGLKNLHRTILGSVSQQQQEIRCMEEHVSLFLARKNDATESLRSKVEKMTTTHSLGLSALTDYANKLQMKAAFDLNQINCKISTETKGIQEYIVKLVLEAKETIKDIHHALAEQKEILAFSAQQREEGLRRSLVSAHVVSKATMDFFNDVHNHASEIKSIIEECHAERVCQLNDFEKKFKEEAAREERLALEQVAVILGNLTSKKNKMVSEAANGIIDLSTREEQRLHHQTTHMQHIAADGRKELTEYIVEAENNFLEDTFSAGESRAVLDSCFEECSKVADNSSRQWENAASAVTEFKNVSIDKIASLVRENKGENQDLCERLRSACSSTDRDFAARADDMVTAICDSLQSDRDHKEKLDSMAASCMGQLKSISEKHGAGVSDIRSKAEQCLTKDYLVDEHTSTTPRKRVITIPSPASIEEMRTRLSEGNSENETRGDQTEGKLHQPIDSQPPDRTPFADMNGELY